MGTDYTITDHARFRGFKSDNPKGWMVGLPKEETNATSQTGVEQEVHLTPTLDCLGVTLSLIRTVTVSEFAISTLWS